MKTINIFGYANTGKTTICTLLINRIIENRGEKIFRKKGHSHIFKIKNKYIGIAPSGDDAGIVENYTKNILDQAEEENINLDYLFFTSRTKGENFKQAEKILAQNKDNAYSFMTNKIQYDPEHPNQINEDQKKQMKVQKGYFLDYILKVINCDFL